MKNYENRLIINSKYQKSCNIKKIEIIRFHNIIMYLEINLEILRNDISDLDEIPNLENIDLSNIDHQFIFFKQDMMYYKFNLKLENYTWIGTKACRMKNLETPQWLRNIKDRSYPWRRLDTLFSKNKYGNI